MPGTQERALTASLKARPPQPEDAAAVALARRLAQVIDKALSVEREPGEDAAGASKRAEAEAGVMIKAAVEYRQVLGVLGLTPLARAQMSGKAAAGPQVDKPKTALQKQRDEVAAARARRLAEAQ